MASLVAKPIFIDRSRWPKPPNEDDTTRNEGMNENGSHSIAEGRTGTSSYLLLPNMRGTIATNLSIEWLCSLGQA